MFLSEPQTYYDLLEITPQASMSEIKNAYLRIKAAYSKDSAATYSLVSQEDIEFLLGRLEEALDTLSTPEKRRSYDIECGFIPKNFAESNGSNVVSIDRVPPMDISETTDDLLIAPQTHFDVPAQEKIVPPPYDKKIHTVIDIANFQLELDRETEWSGEFIKRTREALGISMEELASFSRVSKSYLAAIETDMYKKLPAPVFLRGFLMQICKKLKLPHDRVISAYLDRYKTVCPEKF